MNLNEIRQAYLDDGLDYESASARAAQDVVLEMISSSQLADRVTVKGGVVMQQLSHDNRRVTQDIDFDFLRYSISDESIRRFIKALNTHSKDYTVTIIKEIEELKHLDYSGKRVYVNVADSENNSINTKLDIGVHKDFNLEQTTLYFDVNKLGEGVALLANSKEQIVAEKLKSLLRIGAASTRFKDVFDIYYLVVEEELNNVIMKKALATIIFADTTMREQTTGDIYSRLSTVLSDRRFISNLSKAKNNWLQLPVNKVVRGILEYFQNLK